MEVEELKKLGIVQTSLIDPKRFFIPNIGDVKIPAYYKIEDIFNLIHDKGIEKGIELGKILKQEEICSVLGIQNNTEE